MVDSRVSLGKQSSEHPSDHLEDAVERATAMEAALAQDPLVETAEPVPLPARTRQHREQQKVQGVPFGEHSGVTPEANDNEGSQVGSADAHESSPVAEVQFEALLPFVEGTPDILLSSWHDHFQYLVDGVEAHFG